MLYIVINFESPISEIQYIVGIRYIYDQIATEVEAN